jgi:hypothetical protein
MVRLKIETLEGRDLMSAGVSTGSLPALPEPRTAVMTQPEELAGVAVSLTAPLGSTKGSVVPVDGFTPPIGSNKGSFFSGDVYVNEMGVVGTNREVNGIIAILIGLRAPTDPAAGGAAQPVDGLPYLEQGYLFKATS